MLLFISNFKLKSIKASIMIANCKFICIQLEQSSFFKLKLLFRLIK